MNRSWIVVSDFDGTISDFEVANSIFEEYVGKRWLYYEKLWWERKIGTREAMKKCFEMVRVGRQELESFIRENASYDETFVDFYKKCEEKGIPVYIVSDGVDIYIEVYLELMGLKNRIPYYTNKFLFNGSYVNLLFPYSNDKCGYCGTCKVNVVKELLGRNKMMIYVGDGMTDRHVAEYAEVLYAKKDLAKYCDSNSIEYNRFNRFRDILAEINRYSL